MRINKRIAAVIAASSIAAVSLAGCGHDNFKDLKGVKSVHPDYIENVENMDKHPNIGFLCIHGSPILTTTRSGAGAVHVLTDPDTVRFCHSKEK